MGRLISLLRVDQGGFFNSVPQRGFAHSLINKCKTIIKHNFSNEHSSLLLKNVREEKRFIKSKLGEHLKQKKLNWKKVKFTTLPQTIFQIFFIFIIFHSKLFIFKKYYYYYYYFIFEINQKQIFSMKRIRSIQNSLKLNEIQQCLRKIL